MIRSFFYTVKQAFMQVFRNRGMTLTSLLSITAMMLILGTFFILVVNVNLLTEKAKSQFDTIQIYLLDETDEATYSKMLQDFENMPEVADVEFVDKGVAMEELRARWGEQGYHLDALSENPLPRSIRITVLKLEDADAVVAKAQGLSGIEDIKYYKSEVDKVLNITNGIQIGALVIIMFLVIISIVVVSNTVKLTVLARGREISIMKYVGATNWFIRGPFLAEGMLIGIIAAGLSAGLISLIYYKLTETIGAQTIILFSTGLVPVTFMAQNMVIIFMALGIGIGAVGSVVSMRRFLDT